MSQEQGQHRISAIVSVSGAILVLVGTYLHPLPDDPNDAQAAFAAYAADRLWVASHLIQWLGVVLIIVVFMLLSRRMAHGAAADWAYAGMAGAIGSLSMASALQAIDGIALKASVDAWAAASDNQKAILFQTALGTRQIEIGLASIVTLLTGMTVSIYGIAFLIDQGCPNWLGLLGIIDGVMLISAGLATAYAGFSDIAMTLSMPSSVLLLVWVIIVGVFM